MPRFFYGSEVMFPVVKPHYWSTPQKTAVGCRIKSTVVIGMTQGASIVLTEGDTIAQKFRSTGVQFGVRSLDFRVQTS